MSSTVFKAGIYQHIENSEFKLEMYSEAHGKVIETNNAEKYPIGYESEAWNKNRFKWIKFNPKDAIALL